MSSFKNTTAALSLTAAFTAFAAPAFADGEINIYSYRQPELIQPLIDAKASLEQVAAEQVEDLVLQLSLLHRKIRFDLRHCCRSRANGGLISWNRVHRLALRCTCLLRALHQRPRAFTVLLDELLHLRALRFSQRQLPQRQP